MARILRDFRFKPRPMEIENGCLWIGETLEDYLLMEWDADELPELYLQDKIRYTYDQWKQTWSKKSCTIFQAVWAVSDLWNYKFSLDEIKEIDELSYTKGRVRNAWWYVMNAVKLVCDRWNEKHPDKQVAYYRIDMSKDAVIDKVIDKNYNICSGFYWNGHRTLDYAKDWVLDGTDFGETTYGHAINVIKENTISIKDNYGDRKYNTYALAHYPSQIKTFHKSWYVITKVKDNNLEELKKQERMKALLNTAISLNSELRHTTSDENYKKILNEMNNTNRKKLATVEEILSKLK